MHRIVALIVFLGTPALFAQSADLRGAPGGPFFVPAPGDAIAYFQQINNDGPSAASNVTFTMNTPPFTRLISAESNGSTFFACTAPPPGGTGLITCTAPTLPAGGQGRIVVSVRIDGGTPSGTVITSSYTIGSTTPDPDPLDNVIVQNTTVQWNVVNGPRAELSVTKSATPTATPGGPITYLMTLTNSGPDPAVNVVFTDSTPPNTVFASASQTSGPPLSCNAPPPGSATTFQCTAASFPVGTATFSMTVTAQGSAAGTTVTNTASVASLTFQFNGGDNSASASTTVSAVIIPADISVTNSAPATAVAGTGLITYFPHVRNIGGLPAASVQFTFPIPPQTTFASGSLPGGFSCVAPPADASTGSVVCTKATMNPGEDHVLQIAVRPNANVPHGTVITGTASATTPTPESSTANNSADAQTTITNVANLTTSVTATLGGVPVNSNMGIVFSPGNFGPQPSLGATFSIPLPAGVTLVSVNTTRGSCSGTTTVTCNLGALPAGESAQIVLTVRPTQSGPFSITGTITGHPDQNDPQPANNSAVATVYALLPPVVAKSFNPSTVVPGGITRLTITLTNPNDFDIVSPGFLDVYPAGLANFGAPEAGSTCGGNVSAQPGGTSLAFSTTILAANSTCTISAWVTATGTTPLVNDIPAGSVTTANAGSSGAPASATISFSAIATPTLSEWGLIVLAALLALVAARAMR